MPDHRFTAPRHNEPGFEMAGDFRLTGTPLDEEQIGAPWRRAIAGGFREEIHRIGAPIDTVEGGRTAVHGLIATERALVPLRMIRGMMMSGVRAQRAELPLTISRRMFPAMNAMLAGRSASRRMRYGYHWVPKGTYTRIR